MCIYVAKVYSRVTNIYARGAEPSGRGHGRRGWVGDRPFSLALVLGRARPLQSKSLLLQCLLMGGSVSSAPEFPLASSQLDQFLASTNGVPAVVCRTVADPTPTPARSPPGVPPTQSVPILLRFPSLRICKKGRFFFCCFFPASFFFFFFSFPHLHKLPSEVGEGLLLPLLLFRDEGRKAQCSRDGLPTRPPKNTFSEK